MPRGNGERRGGRADPRPRVDPPRLAEQGQIWNFCDFLRVFDSLVALSFMIFDLSDSPDSSNLALWTS
jgi:hypothetical protein